jgi:hypothetical protein
MLDHLSHILHRWTALSVTGGPTDRDLADLGLTRDQADRLAHLPRAVPERMAAMAAIFGLSQAELEASRDDWLAFAETCADCRHKGACRSTLAKGPAALRTETDFCPNAAQYASLSAALHG